MGSTVPLRRLLVVNNMTYRKCLGSAAVPFSPSGDRWKSQALSPGNQAAGGWSWRCVEGAEQLASGELGLACWMEGWLGHNVLPTLPPTQHTRPRSSGYRKDQWRKWIRKSLPGLFLLPPHLGLSTLEISGWQLCQGDRHLNVSFSLKRTSKKPFSPPSPADQSLAFLWVCTFSKHMAYYSFYWFLPFRHVSVIIRDRAGSGTKSNSACGSQRGRDMNHVWEAKNVVYPLS